ncbi:MAG: hypothetical protein Q4B96_02260 [Bacillota bacterium]|nr:hypothetical protein [Bacillota bacterium]
MKGIASANAVKFMLFFGNFGSGKSELALHFALRAAAAGQPVTLVDLDMINPYFRVSDRVRELSAAGIRLIAPRFAVSNVEIITMNPEIYSAFNVREGLVVFDIGGDANGAVAAGQYKAYFERIEAGALETYLVVNVMRPLSSSADKVAALLRQIEASSRQSIRALINNSNLSTAASGDDLLAGYQVLSEVAADCGLPVAYTSGEAAPLAEFAALAAARGLDERYIGELLPLATQMHRDWQRFIKLGL